MVRLSIAALLTFALTAFAVGDSAGAANVGNGQGKQFITGGCTSDADCASGCCAGLEDANGQVTGAVCSARAVAQTAGKKGCGFPAVGGGAGAAIGNNNNNNNNPNNGANNNQNNGANNGNDGSQNCARSFTA